jgi:hypothetical protein
VGGKHHARPLYIRGRNPVSIVQGDGLAPGPVWMGARDLAPPSTGIRSPGRAALNKSLYRLRYRGPREREREEERERETFKLFPLPVLFLQLFTNLKPEKNNSEQARSVWVCGYFPLCFSFGSNKSPVYEILCKIVCCI